MTYTLLAAVTASLVGGVLALVVPTTDRTPQPAEQPATRPAASAPTEFDKYHFVVLMRHDPMPRLGPDDVRRIQGEHLGHLRAMATAGHLLVAGPFANQFDEKWRGLCIYDGTLSAERVRELAEADPAVQAGLMEVQIMDWYTEKGALSFPATRDRDRD